MNEIHFVGELNLSIQNIGYTELSRNQNFIYSFKNGKPKNTIIHVKTGEIKYLFTKNNNEIYLKTGDVFLIPKNLPYSVTYLRDNTYIQNITFDADKNFPFCDAPTVVTIPNVEHLFNSFTQENTCDEFFITSKIYELLYEIRRQSRKTNKKFKKLLPAIEEIQKNYLKNEKIAKYATICGMSESNFRKLFREYVGMSPVEYRNKIKMSTFKNLMNSGEFTISEAAYLAGFNNMSYFYSIYKKS